MKRIITSSALLAAGLAGLQAANDYGLTPMESSKFWTVSAALRGFYDDNPTMLPDNSPGKTATWGFEVVPSVTLNFPMERTYVAFGYQYNFKYYTEDVFSKHDDQSHQVELKVEHKFTDRYRIRLDDSFVYSAQPDIIDEGQAQTTYIRTEADAIRNILPINFNAQITEKIGAEVGYQNTYVNYLTTDSEASDAYNGAGSLRALMNRMEHLIHVDGRYNIQETIVGLIGYQFGFNDYTGNQPIYPGTTTPMSDIRNNLSHYFYAGVEAKLREDLTFGAKGGGQYTDFDNADESGWTPYFDLSGTYTYLPGSFVRIGFKNERAATDVVGLPVPGMSPTLDQEYSLVYAQVTHRITPNLSGTVLGQYQNSRYFGGTADGESDDFYSVGVYLNYRINVHFSAEAGYLYNKLNSGVTYTVRDFSRNQVFFGVRATY